MRCSHLMFQLPGLWLSEAFSWNQKLINALLVNNYSDTFQPITDSKNLEYAERLIYFTKSSRSLGIRLKPHGNVGANSSRLH